MTGEEIESLENSKIEKWMKDSGSLLIGFLSQQRPNQAHLMKKATLQGLFALGPTFNKNVYKGKWQWLIPGMVWTGVWQPFPHRGVTRTPCPCFVIHGEGSWHRLTRDVSATCGPRQSCQMSAGWLSVVSEQAYLGTAPHLNPKCETSGWPNQLFPFPPVENHRIMAYISCIGGTQKDLKAQLKAYAGTTQGLHMPKNVALADEDPCMSIPALQN